jgi:hypothetical protein
VLFSVAEAVNGRSGWVRSGYNVCYYRNEYFDAKDVTSTHTKTKPKVTSLRKRSSSPAKENGVG